MEALSHEQLDALARLGSLRESGVVTDEEFVTLKNQILETGLTDQPRRESEMSPRCVFLVTGATRNQIQIIKEIREVTALGLKEAKAICDQGGLILESENQSLLESVKERLMSLGAAVELR
jgi:ribosomal protein L7/L12